MHVDARLTALEKWVSAHAVSTTYVLAELPDGTEKEMTVDEMVHSGASFLHIVTMGSMKDLDKILATIPSEGIN